MQYDIVHPAVPFEQSSEFGVMARKLGIKKILWLLEYDQALLYKPKIDAGVAIQPAILTHGVLSAKKTAVARSKSIPIICSVDAHSIRQVIDAKRADMIYGVEASVEHTNHTHHRHSGMNQIIGKLLKKQQITYAFTWEQIRQAITQGNDKILGKMMQNLSILNKCGSNISLVSFATHPYEMRSGLDMYSMLIVLGVSEDNAKRWVL